MKNNSYFCGKYGELAEYSCRTNLCGCRGMAREGYHKDNYCTTICTLQNV